MIGAFQTEQICALANDGMCAADIVRELSVPEDLVRLVLSRNGAGQPEDRDIDDSQLSVLRGRAMELAMQNEDLSVAGRMTQYLIDRDRPKGVGQDGISALTSVIVQANINFEQLKEKYS